MPSDCCIQAKPFLVTITGGAGSGKSQVAKSTAAELGELHASRVPTDYFMLPRAAGDPLDTFLGRPLRYDWAVLQSIIRLPIGAHTTTPDVDFERFTRRGTTGGLPLVVCPVMICDAMLPYPEANLLVRLDVPDEIRFARVVERDIRWGTRVQDRWQHLEMTWQEVSEAPVDIVMDGREPLTTNARRLAAIICESVDLPN
jgi:uridine kinase